MQLYICSQTTAEELCHPTSGRLLPVQAQLLPTCHRHAGPVLQDIYFSYFFFERPPANSAHGIDLQAHEYLFNLIFQQMTTALHKAQRCTLFWPYCENRTIKFLLGLPMIFICL